MNTASDEINVMDEQGGVTTVRVDRLTKVADAPDIAAEHVWQHPKVDQDLATARNNLRINIGEMREKLAAGDPVEKVFIGYAKAIYDARERYGFAHMAIMLSAAVLTLTENEEAPRSIYDDPRLENEFEVDPVMTVDGLKQAIRHPVCGQVELVPMDQKPSPTYLLDLCLLHLRECG